MSTSADNAVRFEAVVPQFTVPDVVQTAEYYRDVLGFQVEGYWDGEKVHQAADHPAFFGIVSRDAIQVFFSRANGAASRYGRARGAYDAYIRVRGIDALDVELRARGADVVSGPEDRVYDQREIVVRDCNGLMVAFGEATSPPSA